MLEETETEEARIFCHHFLLMAFRFEGLGPLLPRGYAYHFNFNAVCNIQILCAFLLV